MQISRALRKSKQGSLHFRKRLSAVLILALVIVVITLVAIRTIPTISVAGDTDPPIPTIGTEDGTGGGGEGGLSTLPEYGSVGGGVIALVICFVAFALFTKRDRLFSKKPLA
jgi:hypothetical protein